MTPLASSVLLPIVLFGAFIVRDLLGALLGMLFKKDAADGPPSQSDDDTFAEELSAWPAILEIQRELEAMSSEVWSLLVSLYACILETWSRRGLAVSSRPCPARSGAGSSSRDGHQLAGAPKPHPRPHPHHRSGASSSSRPAPTGRLARRPMTPSMRCARATCSSRAPRPSPLDRPASPPSFQETTSPLSRCA